MVPNRIHPQLNEFENNEKPNKIVSVMNMKMGPLQRERELSKIVNK